MNSVATTKESKRPSAALAWSLCALATLTWVVVHLVVFKATIMPLSYVVPLLICVWTRDPRMLWGMVVVFIASATVKIWWVLPAWALTVRLDWAAFMAQLFNIVVAGIVIHSIVRLRTHLERRNEELAAANQEVTAKNQALETANQNLEAANEELAAREEEISRQNEELRIQGEELEHQTEELTSQAEELQSANEELERREELLQTLVSATHPLAGEVEVLARVCRDGMKLLGSDVTGAAVMEARADMLHVHAHTGVKVYGDGPVSWPLEQSLAKIVMEQNQTASLDDLSLRPDLTFPSSAGGSPFRAILAAPLSLQGKQIGAVEFYSGQSRPWTQDQFRLARWVAAQCSSVLEMMRLRRDVLAGEARFKATFEQAAVGIAHVGLDGRWLRVNQIYCDILGYSHDELMKLRFQDITHPDDLEPDLAQARRLFAGEIPAYRMEKRYFRKDGSTVWVNLTGSLVRDEQGLPEYAIAVAQDITDRKQAEVAVRQARDAAEAANQAKDRFLAVLSHELRTPLNPALIAATILESHPQLPAELREDVAMIRRNVELEARLIDDMLDLTRIARGKVVLARRIVDGREVLRHAVETCHAQAVEKRIALEMNLPEKPVMIDVDPARLQQVFWNLLKNSIKFTPEGGRITINATTGDQGGLRVYIIDTGKGIEKESLERIFDAFDQGEASVTRQYGGLGLGLAICKGLVAMHDGSICAHSDGPDTGATFVVELPAPTDGVSNPAVQPAARLNVSTAVHKSCRVLLVEDHENTAEMTARLLKGYGHRVTTATTVADALGTFSRGKFDLLISDLGLPDGDGHALLRQLNVIEPIKAIALSGFGMDGDIQQSIEAGFIEHLTKPVNARQLEDAINRALGLSPAHLKEEST